MKLFSTLIFACVMGMALFAGPVMAANVSIVNVIPDRYALLKITDANPGEALDKDAILKFFNEEFEKAKVEHMQFVIYDKGKKEGDGVRALGELVKNSDAGVRYEEPKSQELEKVFEKIIGYNITPEELHSIYSDNEVVADEDFKGKSILIEITVPQVSKDAFDKPYIKVPVDKHGFSGLHIYIDKKDPFLRKIKKGSQIFVRGYPKGFVMKDVVLDGIIISSGDFVLIDGKAVSMEELKNKQP